MRRPEGKRRENEEWDWVGATVESDMHRSSVNFITVNDSTSSHTTNLFQLHLRGENCPMDPFNAVTRLDHGLSYSLN